MMTSACLSVAVGYGQYRHNRLGMIFAERT